MKTSTVLILFGLAAAGGVGFYLYKKKQAPAPSQGGGLFSEVGNLFGGLVKGWSASSSGSEQDPVRVRSPSTSPYPMNA